MSEQERIKKKILLTDPKKWWGDDFDVRFYLISKIKSLQNKVILDLGGGVSTISNELNNNNNRINVDISQKDLRFNLKRNESKIHSICGIMEKIPLRSNSVDCVISGSVLQYAKKNDLINKQQYIENGFYKYPSVENTLSEINRVLKDQGKLFLVTPNNAYYRSYMLEHNELKHAIENHFSRYDFFNYNTFPKLSKKYRKLNFANLVPKIFSKIKNPDKVIESLIKKNNGKSISSVSFYIEAFKN
jgi:ubiquinone/menaquinone biosynthesis C-methylase UbiE